MFIYTSRMKFQKRAGIIHAGTDLRVGDVVPADCTHRGRLHQHRSHRPSCSGGARAPFTNHSTSLANAGVSSTICWDAGRTGLFDIERSAAD